MKRTALLFATALLGVAPLASALDTDPGYGADRPWMNDGNSGLHREGGRWYGGRGGRGEEDYYGGAESQVLIPRYYRPTQRYYGNGYTVSYRYIPVFRTDFPRSGAVGESSNFRTEGFHLKPDEVQKFGANLPRLTQKDERSGAPRTAVTSIVRKKTTTKTSRKATPDAAPTDAPAITPPTSGASTPDASAPAPAPTAAPAKP